MRNEGDNKRKREKSFQDSYKRHFGIDLNRVVVQRVISLNKTKFFK